MSEHANWPSRSARWSAARSSAVRMPEPSWATPKPPCSACGGKRGEVEPEDLSGNLVVQLGLAPDPGEARRAPDHANPPASTYLVDLPVGGFRSGFRRRTPGSPPFSSMNSTPARLSTPSIVASVAASPAYRPTSIFVMVFR